MALLSKNLVNVPPRNSGDKLLVKEESSLSRRRAKDGNKENKEKMFALHFNLTLKEFNEVVSNNRVFGVGIDPI